MKRVAGTEPGQRRLNGPQTTGRHYRNLSEPAYNTDQQDDIPIPMRDGAHLLADLIRPQGGERHPALVAFSPYPRQIQNSGAPLGFVEAGASDFFVPRGYAHVLVNARGTCGSEGEYGWLDEQERRDLFDVIEWVAAQPWCDGRVGMIGISYFAMAQLHAAAAAPPHLAAVFPIATTTDIYRGCAWHGGMLSGRFIGSWVTGVGVMSRRGPLAFRGELTRVISSILRSEVVHKRFEAVNGEAVIGLLGKVMRAEYDRHPWDDLFLAAAAEHPLYDAWWHDRDSTPRLEGVKIPVYLGCDWDNVPLHLPSTFRAWHALAGAPNVRMGLLARGGLAWPWESLHVEALAFFDRWLLGRDTGVDAGDPVRYFLPGADEWRTAPSWPLPELRWTALHLRADGRLGQDPGDDGARDWLYLPSLLTRPVNAHAPEVPAQLAWETSPCAEPVDIIGPLSLELDASVTGADADFIAKLQRIDGRGEAHDLTQGWLRASHRAVDPARSRPGEPWHPHDHLEPVVPGALTSYSIGLVATAQRLCPGERLRLLLTSCDHGGFAMLGFDHVPLGYASRQRVYASSRLILPIAGGGLPRA